MIWPTGEAPNLVAAHNQSFLECLVDLQTWVECLRRNNVNTYPHCSTLYRCGMTVIEAPRGLIKGLEVIDKTRNFESGQVTAAKVGTLITASEAFFDASMVGSVIRFANFESFPITEFVDASSIQVKDGSAAIENQTFTILGTKHPASALGPDDWCMGVRYGEVDMCYVRSYMHRNQHHRCCFPPAFFFGLNPGLCQKGAFPIPTDQGVPKSLPILPLGFHYGQTSTDSPHGRALAGLWAKDQGNIYVIPSIQSSETVKIEWQGIKRTFADADPIDENPLLHQALMEYARWKHYDKWGKDEAEAARAKSAFEDARAMLIHECREETRVRGCEPNHARSSPGALYYNDEQTATATCPDGQTGQAIVQIIPAGTVASNKSIADANAQAKTLALQQAQARLDCTATPVTYHSAPKSYTARCAKTSGAPVPDGDPVTVNLNAGAATSTVSQATADATALQLAKDAAENGLACTWWNTAQTVSCPTGQSGSNVTVQVHTVSSQVSQADADNKAKISGQNQLVCSGGDFWNTAQTVHVVITGCSRHHNCLVNIDVFVAAHFQHSSVSQADANKLAGDYGYAFGKDRGETLCQTGRCGNYQFNVP